MNAVLGVSKIHLRQRKLGRMGPFWRTSLGAMQVRDLQQSSQQMRTSQVVGGRKKERSKEEAGGCQAASIAWLCQEHRMELEWQRLHLAFADDKIYKLG